MAQITITLDTATLFALRRQAKAAGRSLKAEVRRILEAALREELERADRLAFLRRLERNRRDLIGDPRLLPGTAEMLARGWERADEAAAPERAAA